MEVTGLVVVRRRRRGLGFFLNFFVVGEDHIYFMLDLSVSMRTLLEWLVLLLHAFVGLGSNRSMSFLGSRLFWSFFLSAFEVGTGQFQIW